MGLKGYGFTGFYCLGSRPFRCFGEYVFRSIFCCSKSLPTQSPMPGVLNIENILYPRCGSALGNRHGLCGLVEMHVGLVCIGDREDFQYADSNIAESLFHGILRYFLY